MEQEDITGSNNIALRGGRYSNLSSQAFAISGESTYIGTYIKHTKVHTS
jgi:hypothetical protein